MQNKMIYVTQPYLPPLEEFIPSLEQIWNSRVLTNNGPFHQRLERELAEFLGVPHISLFANGTIALVPALQALNIKGDVITTPYSFVATSHSLLWNGVRPVFVDIDPVTFNMDPAKIEASITAETSAILPVHCYGQPCDMDAIQKIADRHNLRVIYDAAHAFGVNNEQGSVLTRGDLSVLSFHATKAFNTFEGGAIVSPSAETKRHIDDLKNFGFIDETQIAACGINGKMSEFNAALGLLQLKYFPDAIAERKRVNDRYRDKLAGIAGISVPRLDRSFAPNYSYFPILIEETYPLSRDELYQHFIDNGVRPRRYFYPLISDFPMYANLPTASAAKLTEARRAAERVLCLPIYPNLNNSEIDTIINILANR